MSDTDVATLREAVQQLSLDQRRVLVLYYAEELTVQEIAMVLDMAEQRVRSIVGELQNLARRALGRPAAPIGAPELAAPAS